MLTKKARSTLLMSVLQVIKKFFLQLYRLLVGNFNQRNTFTRGVQEGVMKDRDRIIKMTSRHY